MSRKPAVSEQALSLPKGGGALKGIGETFQPNLFSGTGNHSIPIALSPSRTELGPSLSLLYSTGSGNGSFGFGWELPIPRVSRKTEKGLPRYDDRDVFVLSGGEDLVPCLEKVIDPSTNETQWIPREPVILPTHTVHTYRPRIEGLFARIERWVNSSTNEVHWRAKTSDNITHFYGTKPASRIADPEDETRVFEWLLDESLDTMGNRIVYEYARDNPALYTNHDSGLGLDEIFEQNRAATQLYLRRILYGNLPEPLVRDDGSAVTYSDGSEVGLLRGGRRFCFEAVFDYGDWNLPTVEPHPGPPPENENELFGPDPASSAQHNPVPLREDRFSSFRPGFEIRTLRRCRRILMFHHFAELGGPTLVRSTDFTYETDFDTRLSFLTGVTVTSYRKDSSGDYKSVSMPEVTFAYTEFKPHAQRYQAISAPNNDLPPLALKDPNLALVDLFGDGLPGILQTAGGQARYWKNLGGGVLDRPRSLAQIPASLALSAPGVGFGDMGGDGQTDLLVHSGPLPGFYETTPQGAWRNFKPYRVFPNFDIDDPNVRLVDLTGDGRSDALMTQGDHFLWFECLGEEGFAAPEFVPRLHDLDQFPDVFFADPSGRVRLADMKGGGLNDIVLIHNGRINYWPNLGYGRFGRRITMENAPRLDVDFNPKRLFLVDLNGTGCADLVYVDFDRVHFWFNQSGNQWSQQQTIFGTPTVSDSDSIQFTDVFGTGTATLLWTSDFSAQPEGHYKALDFCGGVKPYVLEVMSNNLGATTRVHYAPSTRFFLEDERNGTPWITKLPFPVQVVEKVEVIDAVGRTKHVTRYKYHHGYFDGREREFRGFGRVDKFDTETFEEFTSGGDEPLSNRAPAFHSPTVETRSWFHTGIYFDEESAADISDLFDVRQLMLRYRSEFYQEDRDAFSMDEDEVDSGATPHEAHRALRGALIRTEIYARDGSPMSGHPYQVTEARYRVVEIQPKDRNQHGVYFSHQLEGLNYHYERDPSDPRINHALTLEVDSFGNPLRSIAVGYGRRRFDPQLPTQADQAKQTETFITYTANFYTNGIDELTPDSDHYLTPLPSETRSFELTGFQPTSDPRKFTIREWIENDFARLENTPEIPYEDAADENQEQKRLIEHLRTRYRRDDLSDLLPLGVLEPLALPGESLKLAFTLGLIAKVYGNRVADEMLETHGGYVQSEGWWIPSDRVFFSPNPEDTAAAELDFARRHFFAPHRSHDPFGNVSLVKYDPYVLLRRRAFDSLENSTTADNDYRVLQPFRLTDANGNRTEVVFDTLGLVAGTAVMGKSTESKGDSLLGFEADLSPQQRAEYFADPLQSAASLLGRATTRIVYDLDRFLTAQEPVYASSLAREVHASESVPSDESRVQVSFAYSDGFGREIQKKVQAEPSVERRWVGSGWTIFNNKGSPVRQFEAFFDDTHEFRFGNEVGVSSTLFYDPVGRVIAKLHPNHTWRKIVFNPWRQETWDVNDTLLIEDPRLDADVGEFFKKLDHSHYLPTWHAQRLGGALGVSERAAALKTEMHAATPSVVHADALGRFFLALVHNRLERNGAVIEETYATRMTFDIEGNQREVIDAKDRIVMRYDFDMLGTRIHQSSMEAGERWLLKDVQGNTIYAFDSRGHRFRTIYDELRRPIETYLSEHGGPEVLIGRTVYGESLTNPEEKNQRGKVVQAFDQAGVVSTDDYDFKGNLLESRRQLARDYQTTLDWSPDPELEEEIFIGRTSFDALNRPRSVVSPDGSVYKPTFNAANLLERIDVQLRGAATPTPFVTKIYYDAKGQRKSIVYGNGATTVYDYDPETFRLIRLRTSRESDVHALQDLIYTYDPVGNLTQIRDDSQQSIYFQNQVVEPHHDYVYDAVYRLIAAQGREHVGQISQPETTWNDEFRVRLEHPHDGQAMRRFTERYEYDPAGNFERMIHQSSNGNWTRSYDFEDASQLEAGLKNNRLSSTSVGSANPLTEVYAHDAHGNMTTLPHLASMIWNHHDQLQRVDLGGGGTAFYVYDSTGERTRKVIEKNGGAIIEERIYLGGFEIFRRRGGAGEVVLERETLHVMDDQQRIALVETRTQGSDGSPSLLIRYQFANHLGSAVLELDDHAQIVSYEEYYPYGGTAFQAGRTVLEESRKRYRYSGMERDEETGLNYHGARYYTPWLGRWTSFDPLGIEDGLNGYVGFHDNPIRFIDPLGFQNTPWNFVEYAPTVEAGLNRIRELGLQKGKEYGLGLEPKSGKLMVLSGGNDSVHFGKLTPLGHTHTAVDKTSRPSGADLNEFARQNVKEHWIYGEKDGWTRIRYDKKTNTFDVHRSDGKNVARYTIFQNPSFNPKDTSLMGQASRWKSSVVDVKPVAEAPSPPSKPGSTGGAKGGPTPKGSGNPSEKGTAVAVGVLFAVMHSNSVKEAAVNVPLAIAATRVPYVLLVTAKDEGEAGAGIVLIHVATKFPLTAFLIGAGAGVYKGGMWLKPGHMNAPVMGTDQTWAKPWSEGGTKSGCGTCHESVRIDNAYKTDPRLRMYEEVNGAPSRNGIVTDQAIEFYLKSL